MKGCASYQSYSSGAPTGTQEGCVRSFEASPKRRIANLVALMEEGPTRIETVKVLQIVRPSAGGIRTHVRSLTSGLLAHGHSAAIASPTDLKAAAAVSWVAAPITGSANPIRDLQAAIIVSAAARSADILHGHGLRAAWIACLAARIAQKPFLFTAHNLVPPSPGTLARRSLRFVCRRASAIVAVSRAVADGLRLYAPQGAVIDIIPNGIDAANYAGSINRAAVCRAMELPETALTQRKQWVVAVGRLSREKGFDVLIEAAAQFDQGVCLIIAGDGPERDRLVERVAALGLRDRVFLPGFVEDAAAILRAADVVVIPSREEGQGIVALEAMASGAPIIASRVGGLEETVGGAGLLISPDDALAISDACKFLLRDEEERKNLVQIGLDRVRASYSLDAMIRDVEAVYARSRQ